MKSPRFVVGLAAAAIMAAPAVAQAAEVSISVGSGPVVVAPEPAPGPPPHAPAHGYRKKFKHYYRYYPGPRVYFDTGRSLWFWTDGHNWQFGAMLPDPFRLHLGAPVEIGMDIDRPYLQNDIHVREYPPGPPPKAEKHQNGHVPPGQAKKGKK